MMLPPNLIVLYHFSVRPVDFDERTGCFSLSEGSVFENQVIVTPEQGRINKHGKENAP